MFQSTKMFHVYTAAPRPTPKRSHQPQHTPKTGTHGDQAPPHPPVHTTPTHQHLLAYSGQRHAKAAHTNKRRGAKPTGQFSVHTGSTQSAPPVEAHPCEHEHPPAQSAQPPPENPEHSNDKGTKLVKM